MNGWFSCLVIGACAVLVLLPPKWDPAIRLKEWAMKQREKK